MKINGWNSKKRTMLRYIKNGDIFCFNIDKKKYGFGRIIEKISGGHVAEIYSQIKTEPTISEEEIENADRIMPPIVIESYGLFDKKRNGEWQIIGNDPTYVPEDYDKIFFYYGAAPNDLKKENVKGEFVSMISEDEAKTMERSGPLFDAHIKNRILLLID